MALDLVAYVEVDQPIVESEFAIVGFEVVSESCVLLDYSSVAPLA